MLLLFFYFTGQSIPATECCRSVLTISCTGFNRSPRWL